MRDLTDAELVALARTGDKSAFGALVERYLPVAQRVALRTVSRPDLADDLAQEAMLQAYLSLESLRDDARFGSWLYGIVLNVCRSYLRAQKIDWYSLDEMVGGRWLDINPFAVMEPGPQEAAEALDLHGRVLHAVEALSPANREAVLLFYYDQLSLREAAIVLGISVPAPKVRLHRARDHLRRVLLPVYEDLYVEKEEAMIEVKLANVIRVENRRIHDMDRMASHVILLLDESGRRVVPVWIGPGEAMALVMSVLAAAPESAIKRPVTWNFVTRILDSSGAELVDVIISALKDEVFYATAHLRSAGVLHNIDARPSDAIPLALLMGKPIYVTEEVMTLAHWPIPESMAIQDSLLGVGTAGLTLELTTAELEFEQTLTHAEWEALDEKARKQYSHEHEQALMNFVLSA